MLYSLEFLKNKSFKILINEIIIMIFFEFCCLTLMINKLVNIDPRNEGKIYNVEYYLSEH